MGFLSATAAVLGTCVAGVVTKIAADEFAACASPWATRIVRCAVRRLPEDERAAAEAEWLAHVEDVPGNVSKLLHACGLWRMVLIRTPLFSYRVDKYLTIILKCIPNSRFFLINAVVGTVFTPYIFIQIIRSGDTSLYAITVVIAMFSVIIVSYFLAFYLPRILPSSTKKTQ